MALPFAVPSDLFPVEHRFLELDGARIHYVDEGSGETLLLLHGNPSWSFLYRQMISGEPVPHAAARTLRCNLEQPGQRRPLPQRSATSYNRF